MPYKCSNNNGNKKQNPTYLSILTLFSDYT